jgi:nicotinate-nucleotide adenylyltransferase
MVPMPQLDISSTAIRNYRKQGRSVRYLVPEEVRTYMEGEKLYES